MDPDQTAWMRWLVWIHAGRKPIMLVLSWRGSFIIYYKQLLFMITGVFTVTGGSYNTSLQVMPLVSGFIPLPKIKLYKYNGAKTTGKLLPSYD
jgi:hypothetical protein